MSVSRTMTDLRHNADEIARLCRESSEPVFITGTDQSDLVVMSAEAYGRWELYRLLDEAESDFQNGDRGISVEAMRKRFR